MRSIAVFARHPVPGRVKTRLSPALPAPLACDLYRGMLGDALEAAHASRADQRLIFWAETDGGPRDPEVPAGFEARLQSGRDLGDRLETAFAELLCAAGDQAVVTGADCPTLTVERIQQAFDALDSWDLVLGPTGDGGYYLVGLSRRAERLFRDIDWGTARVREQTLERAAQEALRVHELARLDDVDTAEDLVRLIAAAAAEPGRCGAHTRMALEAMGLLPARG